jgi:hypothetical protein
MQSRFKSVFVVLTLFFVALCGGCEKHSPTNALPAGQKTAEEAAWGEAVASFLEATGYAVKRYEQLTQSALQAETSEQSAVLLQQRAALIHEVRDALTTLNVPQTEYRWLAPESMEDIRAARRAFLDLSAYIKRGNYVSDDIIIDHLRSIVSADKAFSDEVHRRPAFTGAVKGMNFELYASVSGVPAVYAFREGVLYVGPTIKLPGLDFTALVPVGTAAPAAIRRIIIRDPATMTQRVFMLDTRFRGLRIDAGVERRVDIDVTGTDLVVTPR